MAFVLKSLIDKIGGALTTILVTALLALVAMLIKHDSEIALMKYRLNEIEKDFEEHDDEHKVKK